jgi:hypothetical protein
MPGVPAELSVVGLPDAVVATPGGALPVAVEAASVPGRSDKQGDGNRGEDRRTKVDRGDVDPGKRGASLRRGIISVAR